MSKKEKFLETIDEAELRYEYQEFLEAKGSDAKAFQKLVTSLITSNTFGYMGKINQMVTNSFAIGDASIQLTEEQILEEKQELVIRHLLSTLGPLPADMLRRSKDILASDMENSNVNCHGIFSPPNRI